MGSFVLRLQEISVAFVLSDGPPPERFRLFDPNFAADFEAAKAAYDNLSEDNKGLFREPDLFHFPSLQAYLDYLPR